MAAIGAPWLDKSADLGPAGTACPLAWCGRAGLTHAAYSRRMRRRCASLRTSRWFGHSRRMLPRNRSQTALVLRAGRGAHHRDVARRGHANERPAALAVVVADEPPGPPLAGPRLAPLPGDPRVGQAARDARGRRPAPAERDHDAGVPGPEEHAGDGQDVAGPDRVGKVAPLAADAPRAPPRHGPGHLPDPRDRLGWAFGLLCGRRGSRCPPPGVPEQPPVPAQERGGLDDQHRLPPGADAARQERQQRAVGGPAVRQLDAPLEHDELLARQRVLGDQLPLASGEVSQRPGEGRGCGRSRSSREAATKRLEGATAGAGEAVQEASEHGQLPIKHEHCCPKTGAMTPSVSHDRADACANQPARSRRGARPGVPPTPGRPGPPGCRRPSPGSWRDARHPVESPRRAAPPSLRGG